MDNNGSLAALEARTATLFLVASGFAAVFLANTALKTFTGTSYPVVQGLIGPAGFLLGVVGLLGLYPALAARTPRLARVAAAVAAISAAGWTVIVATGIGRVAGVMSEPSGPLAIVPIVVIVTMVLGFGLFGVTSLRAGSHSRVVGGLLLLESAMFLALIANAIPFVLIDLGHVLAFLGVGISLRSRGIPTESAEPAADATP